MPPPAHQVCLVEDHPAWRPGVPSRGHEQGNGWTLAACCPLDPD
jgi:hypothetical protein